MEIKNENSPYVFVISDLATTENHVSKNIKLLDRSNTALNPMRVITATKTVENVAVDGYGMVNIPLSIPNGYTVVGASAAVNGGNLFIGWIESINTNVVNVCYLNKRTSAQTAEIKVTAYCQAN